MDIKFLSLNDLHIALGAKMAPFAGYNMPVRYSSDIEEHNAVRQQAGIFDVSHMGEFTLEGEGALALIQKITSNDASRLKDGEAQYSCFPNEQGGIVDDLLVYKLNSNKYMLVVNASNIEKDWNWVNKFNDEGVKTKNISDQTALFAIQGPKASSILQKLTDVKLSEIPYYNFVEGNLAGIPMIISATGYTGAGGFELYFDSAKSEAVWKEIFKAGESEGLKPTGLGARDTLRLEMGYCLYGNDINDTTSPIEAGLGWITKFNKDFISKEKFLKQKEEGTTQKLVGFKMVEKGIPRSHYPILNEKGEKIGEVTSGTMSPTLNIGLGMGYVKKEFSKVGTEIYIGIRDKQIKAVVSAIPFVKK